MVVFTSLVDLTVHKAAGEGVTLHVVGVAIILMSMPLTTLQPSLCALTNLALTKSLTKIVFVSTFLILHTNLTVGKSIECRK